MCVCVSVCLCRSKDATEEMEALVKAQNNPDEIELGEEGDEEEPMVEGEVVPLSAPEGLVIVC